MKAGERGPALLEDFVLREKIFHFDHERIPERIVHARGSGSHGTFEVTKAIPEWTKAALFQKKGNSCPVFVRFSTVFYRSQTENEQAHIASALVFELSKVQIEYVPPRVVARLRNIDEDLAKRVADGLGIDLPGRAAAAKKPIDLGTSDALSIQKRAKPTFHGRKIGILFDEGSDRKAITEMVAQIQEAGGTACLVAPKIGPLKLKGGEPRANGQHAGSPSVLCDAVVAMLQPERAAKLAKSVGAVAWFADAWYHCKTIGACTGIREHLLPKANIEPDESVVDPDAFASVGPIRHWAREEKVRDLA